MKKQNLLFTLVVCLLGVCCQSQAQMYISGRHLYSQAGEKVIMRGTNEMFWGLPNRNGSTVIPEIARTGANVLRIGWLTTVGTASELDAAVTNCLNAKMIPMVEIHDATGDLSRLQTCVNFWLRSDIKSVVNKHRKWFLLNIANEAGNSSVTATAFKEAYKNAITQLRNAGYTVPLIIDASSYGQNEQIIFDTWREIFNHDPLKRCMFSVHTYWISNQYARLDNVVAQVTSQGIPFIFGEGPQPNGYDCTTGFPYLTTMKKCQENQIGWLTWSWGAVNNNDCGPNPNSKYDITTNGVYGNWASEWARLTTVDDYNSIKRTSVRPPSLLNSTFRTSATTGQVEESMQDEADSENLLSEDGDFSAGSFQLFPNPYSGGDLVLKFTSKVNDNIKVQLIDPLGRVRSVVHLKAGENRLPVDASLPNGLYSVKVQSGQQVASGKLLLKR